MTRIIPVFVNSNKIELPTESTALDAVRLWSEAAANEVLAGTRVITDDRGLPIVPETTVHGGSIFRLVPARAAGEASDALPVLDVLDASDDRAK
jgi:hypothetical protein